MVPPNVYIDAPTLSPEVLEELRDALFSVRGVQAVTVVDILPGQRRHLQLDALLAAMTDPVLALDSAGKVLLANPALIALYGREPDGESVADLFADPALLDALLEHGFRLPLREITVNGQTLLLDATPITDAGALLTLYQPNRIGERLSALHHDHAEGFDALLGESPAIRTLKARAQRVAALDAPLLIQGETGTGKELVARACHAISARTVQAVPGAELRGTAGEPRRKRTVRLRPRRLHRRATGRQAGLMELANQGTVFLDEIGEMSPYLQAKLLRFLNDGSFRRVGRRSRGQGQRADPQRHPPRPGKMVSEGLFREDLFYRLNVLNVRSPAAARTRPGHPAAGPLLHAAGLRADPAPGLSPGAGHLSGPAGQPLAGQRAATAKRDLPRSGHLRKQPGGHWRPRHRRHLGGAPERSATSTAWSRPWKSSRRPCWKSSTSATPRPANWPAACKPPTPPLPIGLRKYGIPNKP